MLPVSELKQDASHAVVDDVEVHEFDVIVAGSGTAGLTAAVVAAQAGLSVVVVEKAAHFGGTSAWSGGGCWVPCNPLIPKIGLVDTRAAAELYVKGVVGEYLRDELLATFLDQSPKMLSYMLENTEVKFFPRTPAPDYHMTLPGALVGGRSLASPVYDGRKLGPLLKRLQKPLNSFNAPWGMMMSPLDFMHAMKSFKSWASFLYMVKLAGRYAIDYLRYRRGTRLTMGNALVARLLRSASDAGVKLLHETSALRLVQDTSSSTDGTGRVTGLVVLREGREVVLKARRGVVLATGGFSANPSWRAKHFTHAEQHESMTTPGNVGDGIQMALDIGAVLETKNSRNAAYSVVSRLAQADGSVLKCLHFFTDLPKPGCIAVDERGKRFGNEADLQLGNAMLDTNSVPAWIVCDHRFIKKYGLGLVYPFGLNLGRMLRSGYLVRENSIESLASRIAVDARVLNDAIGRNNRFASVGVDEDFGRGASALDRSMGDPSNTPNPCLGPINKGPFYALKIHTGDAGSVLGLRVDTTARALDAQDRVIDGLHVCGLDMNSIWAGRGVANGMNHAHNMTFGFIAARALSACSDGNERVGGFVVAAGPAATPQ